jgi:hypothetical protein
MEKQKSFNKEEIYENIKILELFLDVVKTS